MRIAERTKGAILLAYTYALALSVAKSVVRAGCPVLAVKQRGKR